MWKIIKFLLAYWLELLIGGLILIFVEDIRWFLFYFLIISLLSSELRTDYLRKLIRVFQVANERKLVVIMKKLKISPEELMKFKNDSENDLTKEQRESLYKDMNDLGLQ